MRKRLRGTLTLICVLGILTLLSTASADEVERMRVHYFGNSLTRNSMPEWHAELGKSAEKEWVTTWFCAAGAPIWMLRERLVDSAAKWYSKKALDTFLNEPWDAMTLQPFGWWGLERQKDGRELGDIHNASEMIRMFLKAHPDAKVFIYANWPCMEPNPKLKGRDARENPDRESFDYEQQWLKKYDPEAEWVGNTFRTRDYMFQLFEALKARFPELWEQGRLRMIPAGDVFFELNRKMRAGRVPGIADIKEFYTDIQHIRIGLPRYSVAAAFYACLFGEHPGQLDWRVYNDAAKYGLDDPHHDKGGVLEITGERAKVVNDTIWEVLVDHPYAGLKKRD